MSDIHYYFDESGEKGHVCDSHADDAIGLVAGLALPDSQLASFTSRAEEFMSKLAVDEGEKLHATEIFRDGRNSEIKQEVFDFLAGADNWTLVYEAVYPKGLYVRKATTEELLQPPSSLRSPVKLSKNPSKERIYTHLVEGAIVKLDEIARMEECVSVVMQTDRIDSGLLKELHAALSDLQSNESTIQVTGYDPEKKAVVRGAITTSVIGFDIAVTHIKEIKTEMSESPLTFLADLVANALYRHLKAVIKAKGPIALHSNAAVADFPLHNKVAFVGEDYVPDLLYRPTI